MKIDLTALQQKIANGDFIGFKLTGNDGKGATKLAAVKLGLAKNGMSKAGIIKPTGKATTA